MTESSSSTAGTVARVARLLKRIAESDGEIAISRLATQLDLAPSTVHRLLHLLMAEGFVERAPGSHRYRIGLELYRVGALVADRVDVPKIARPVMRSLAEACNEFCMLCVYLPSEREIMIAEIAKSRHPIGYGAEKYRKMAIAWGATGKAILAYLDPDEIAEIYRTAGPSPATGAPLPPWEEFIGGLAEIRARGYAFTRGEKMPGAVGITAPVFGSDGRVMASLCLTVPELRFTPEVRERVAGALLDHASRLSRALGYRAAAATQMPLARAG